MHTDKDLQQNQIDDTPLILTQRLILSQVAFVLTTKLR